ncbi:Glutathione S-transferase GST-6.0 [Roseovarius litorisediminis]|uniref:Glutathione S-transferase GST-6.0 n=1 Tax=Roseovarius litorisediminis TaxID=1312363 RepID=A0A1Y5SJC6_9RHOB|nr:glutathione transferase GstA [Roseovarius litorisediminis]SLN38999.1 Glutathione S-transferase GST-6.0 [Roseovarius litorisediminis]
MKLYYIPGACSVASHIMLNEVGASFEIEAVDPAAGKTETGRDFREINVNGYVPALETESGDILTEGASVLQFIADSNPDRAYSPAPGSIERARVQQFLNYGAAELHKSWGPLFAGDSTDAEKAAASTKVQLKFDYLERVLSDGREFLVGNQFSAADAYIFILSFWANFKNIDLNGWPKLSAYVTRIAERPATQAAFAAEGLA